MSVAYTRAAPSAGATTTLRVRRRAATVLGGHRAVTVNAAGELVYADPADTPGVVFVTTAAATAGELVDVVTLGPIADPSFAFTPGALVFVGTDGHLVEVEPAAGASVVVGYAETSTTLYVQPRGPVVLATP